MCINRSVSGRTSQILVFPVGDVQVSSGISVLLGKAKINHIHLRASSSNSHQEVVGFDITVDEASGVDVLNTADQLVCKQKNGLVREFTVTVVEQIL